MKKAPKAQRMINVPIELDPARTKMLETAAAEAHESPGEFAVGGVVMRLSQQQQLLETFLAGFPMKPDQVQALSQMPSLRKAAQESRKVLLDALTCSLEMKARLHKDHLQEELEASFQLQ